MGKKCSIVLRRWEILSELDEEIENYLKEDEYSRILMKFNRIREYYDTKELIISFCGVFSSGKSSLINALLAPYIALPTGFIPITKRITRIEYGDKYEAFYVCDNRRVTINIDDALSAIKNEFPLPDECSEIVFKIPSFILMNNVVFLDLPGCQDTNKLELLAKDMVDFSDIVVFCLSATTPLRMFERGYLSKLNSYKFFIAVLNHMDSLITEDNQRIVKNSVLEYMNPLIGDSPLSMTFKHCKTLYCTVAKQDALALDGLNDFIHEICYIGAKKDIEFIKYLAKFNGSSHLLLNLREKTSKLYKKGEDLYKLKAEEVDNNHKKQMIIYNNERERICSLIVNAKQRIYQLLKDAVTLILNEFDTLEREGDWYNFHKRAKSQIYCNLSIVTDFCANWEKEMNLQKSGEFDKFYSAFKSVLDAYEVPKPEGRWVKKRGFWENQARKVTAFFSETDNLTDNVTEEGYRYLHFGYANTAKTHLIQYLSPIISNKIDEYLENVKRIVYPNEPPKDNELCEKLREKYLAYQSIEEEISAFDEKIYLECKSSSAMK